MVFVSIALSVVHLSHGVSMAPAYRAVGTATDIRKIFYRGFMGSRSGNLSGLGWLSVAAPIPE
jgi:hypothetical protein